MTNRKPNPAPGPKHGPRRLYAVTVCVLCLAAVMLCAVAAGRLTGLEVFSPPEPTPVTTDVTVESVRGTQIPATVTLPDTASAQEEMPLVVMCHGFTGNRDGDGHFQPLADTLARSGIASIRVDFAGNGESTEEFTAYTLTSIYDDIESAISYMRDNYTIGPLGLVGHSMGGRAVSLHLNGNITAAALWSPANGDGLDGLEFLDHSPEGREQMRADAAGTGSYGPSGWNVTISSEFIEQMDASHPCDNIRYFSGALLIAFAGGDTELLSQTTIDETLQAARDRSTGFVDLSDQFADATHNYTAPSGDEAETAEIGARLENATADFLIDALLAEDAA